MTDLQKKYSWINQKDYESVAGDDWPAYEIFCQHVDIEDFVYQEIDEMLSQPVAFDHPSFCVLPFYGREFPSNSACCLMAPADLDEVKKEMLLGIRPKACQKCWSLEDRGLISDRLLKNSCLDFHQDKDIHKIFQDCLDGNYGVIHYKIDTSNTCNAACITCNDYSSTTWAKLKQKNGLPAKKEWRISTNQLAGSIDYAKAEVMSFRGGESFLSDTNFQILEKLIEHGNLSCFVSFVTNGSFKLSKRQKQILQHFDRVNFCFSIDGTDSVFEYLRYPLKFDKIKENIEHCKDTNVTASVSYTLSNLNLLYHSRTVDWFAKNDLSYLLNPVYDPLHFSPSALPKKIKDYIYQYYNHPDIEKYLVNHLPEDDANFVLALEELKTQDGWKKIHLENYLPELANLIEKSQN